MRDSGKPTIPSTLGVERATNPFLRADDAGVAAAVGLTGAIRSRSSRRSAGAKIPSSHIRLTERPKKKQMKLRYSATSPYVRKVMMVIHEHGLSDRIELEKTDAWSPKRICPTTIRWAESGTGAWRRASIVRQPGHRRISGHAGGSRDISLFPATSPDRWTALRFQALADGICDAAILRRLEGNRPEQLR